MEIILNTEKIKKALSASQSVCSKKTISDITQNILFELENNWLLVKATDTEVFSEISIETNEIKKNSNIKRVIINARIIYEIIKDIQEEELTLSFTEKKCKIKTKYTNADINLYEEKTFPEIQLKTENILKIKNKKIIDSIDYCSHLSSSTMQKTGIGVILFEIEQRKLITTATDGHCLGNIVFKNEIETENKNFNFLLSKKSASDLKRILETMEEENNEIFIGKSNEEIVFSSNQLTIAIKTVKEKFPEYRKILNDHFPNKFICTRSIFSKITKRLSLFTENKFIPAKMTFEKEKKTLHFKIENQMIGQNNEEMEVAFLETEEAKLQYSVFPPYLLKASMEMQNKEDQFEIKAKKHNNPMVFSSISEEEERHYIVMPMRSE
jgi:DNA polymerase III beta subunit